MLRSEAIHKIAMITGIARPMQARFSFFLIGSYLYPLSYYNAAFQILFIYFFIYLLFFNKILKKNGNDRQFYFKVKAVEYYVASTG